MKTWNQRFAEALAESEYTKNSLAKTLGVSAPTVQAWAAAGDIAPAQNITGENLLKVCKLLKINPDWLIFERGAKSGTGLTAVDGNSVGQVNHDSPGITGDVKQDHPAAADDLKKEILKAVAEQELSDDLLNAIAWMIRAAAPTVDRGNQHHTKTVKLKHGQAPNRRASGT